ncbi:cation:proton antiporter [Candidatus Woesearchaeota archaeon]|nr:cation:proton antiporter [Candidatus Woesearchaeota archaeon]
MENLILQLSMVILIAIVFGAIMRLLKQPLLIGYILTGIVASPSLLNLVSSTDSITVLSQIGIAFLLFMVGLTINPRVIKEVGRVSVISAVGQVLFTAIICYFLAKFLGFSTIAAEYIAVATTFSSTIIIMKLLSDKGDLDKLYGRIAIGFLIVQDLIAVFVLMLISSTANTFTTTMSLPAQIARTLFVGVGVLFLLFLIGMYVLPKILDRVAKSQEFLLLFSVGWCLLLAALFWAMNFSLEIGALLAGITLSLSPYRYEISSKMKPLRDFFIVIFFIILGAQLSFGNMQHSFSSILIFSLFILIGNPLILMIIMGFLGYTKRTSFEVGLTVAQVSEFSFIMIALGVKVGHLTQDILAFMTIVGLITIAGSTYLIMYSEKWYALCEPWLGIFERKGKKQDAKKVSHAQKYDILLFGYNRMGYDLLESFKKLKKKFLIVDYDPEIVLKLTKAGYDCKYGDASDVELLEELSISKAKMIISTIPDTNINALLIKKTREKNSHSICIVISHYVDEAMHLYKAGATYVVMPHFIGGGHTSTMIKRYGLNVNKFLKERASHLKNLQERKRQKNVKKLKELYHKMRKKLGRR